MSIIRIVTPFNIDLEFRIANFPRRVLAWFIDILIISGYYYAMDEWVVPNLSGSEDTHTASWLFFEIIPVMLYMLISEIMMNGQTLGKKLVGIKIIDKLGQEATLGQFFIRWLMSLGNIFIYCIPMVISSPLAFIFFCGIVYLPDGISMLVSAHGQRLGDLAAGTVVIDANYVPDITQTIYQEIEVTDYKPLYPQVMRLTDRDINGIRNLLQMKLTRDTENYMQQVVYKIKQVLNIEDDAHGPDFLQQLLHDYNFIISKDVN